MTIILKFTFLTYVSIKQNLSTFTYVEKEIKLETKSDVAI